VKPSAPPWEGTSMTPTTIRDLIAVLLVLLLTTLAVVFH
jgi:hypothetical protein